MREAVRGLCGFVGSPTNPFKLSKYASEGWKTSDFESKVHSSFACVSTAARYGRAVPAVGDTAPGEYCGAISIEKNPGFTSGIFDLLFEKRLI